MAGLPTPKTPLSTHPGAVQDRTASKRRVVFGTRSVRANRSGWFERGYDGDVDLFAVYCPELRRLYAVPIEVAPRGSGTLRIAPAANNQSREIRWAADFEVPA
jgi:hypothetical protein